MRIDAFHKSNLKNNHISKTYHIINVPRGTFMLLFLFLYSCSHNLETRSRPNIVWIVAEDLSPVIPSFGDSTIVTANLSRLAKDGICYDRVFSPSGVCSPSRAAIATGMYPTHIGANHMRTGPWFPGVPESFIQQYAKNAMPAGLTPYETVPASEIRMVSELLRADGYYCTNNSKEDYQFRKSPMAWDESSRNAHWRGRAQEQPFFSVFNINVTHESQIWAKASDSLWIDSTMKIPVPPYLPNTSKAKKDVRRMYSNIKEMDNRVGKIIDELEDEHLLEDTYIFWYTDHGGPLPRQKRLLYDSGIRVPMIIRLPGKKHASSRDDQLISFIDFAPTILSIAGVKPPDYMDGRAFLGEYAANKKRDFIHAAADRFDESPVDRIRAVRNERFKLIKYFDQELPMFLHVRYRDQMGIMQELHRLREVGQLTMDQALWFRESKPEYELFDLENDPHELHNLYRIEDYADIQKDLTTELNRWLGSFEDLNMIPEEELVERFWPGGQQPVTETPLITRSDSNISLSCRTKGASIGYQIVTESDSISTWQVYSKPLQLGENQTLRVIAHRIGFKTSEEIVL